VPVEKGTSNIVKIEVRRITQRSTGRQKQWRFLPVGNLLVKERYDFKRNSFLLLPPVSLVLYARFHQEFQSFSI